MNKRGSVPLFVCAMIPAVVLMGGFAMKAANRWLDQARLQVALDAGALAAARDMNRLNGTAAEKQAAINNIKALVAGIYNENAPTSSRLSASDVTVNPTGSEKVELSASVNSVNPATGGTTQINRSATANPTNTGIELALVMDTTLSMGLTDGTKDETGATPARIEWAKRAALDLVDVLYGGQTTYQPNLYISVVPFNVAINIGTGQTQQGWLTGTAPSYTHSTLTYSWSGCVEARPNGYDVREDKPSTGNTDTLFRRYYWPNTYVSAETSNAKPPNDTVTYCNTSQDYTSNGNGVCWGNNDWAAPLGTQKNNPLDAKLRSITSAYGTTTNRSTTIVTATSSQPVFGPNFMCPSVPILPLTMHRPTVEAKIRELVGTSDKPYPFGFGTVVATGLQGAWYTLSENWRGLWQNPDPSGAPRPATGLPLDYGTPKMTKVVVLLSDGDNNWFSARHDSLVGNVDGSNNTLTRPESRRTELFYNAYGVLSASNNRLGVNPMPSAETSAQANSKNPLANNYTTVQARADEALDTRTLALCTAMKGRGIIIYAVGVGIPSSDSNARNLLSDCVTPKANPNDANERSKFINTSSAQGLRTAFTQIANELASLRLSQ